MSRLSKIVAGAYIRHHGGNVFRITNGSVCHRPGYNKVVTYQALDKYCQGSLDKTFASTKEYMLGDSNTQFGYVPRFMIYTPMNSELEES